MERHKWTEITENFKVYDKCEKCGCRYEWKQNYTPGVYGGAVNPQWVYTKNETTTVKNPGCN